MKPLFPPKSVWLAPMAGVTDRPFRRLCRENGCVVTFTEMVSARHIIQCGPSHHTLEHLLATLPNEKPCLQLFGSEPSDIEEAVRRIDLSKFFSIDINMGCPARKITANGEGSALMLDMARAERMVAAAKSAAESTPVSVKMRAGWDDSSCNAAIFARAMQQAGASFITVHGRTRAQQFTGKADLAVIAEVKSAVTIPVIGNGDVINGETALTMLRETGCDAIMVGRGAMGNPWVFNEISCAINGLPYSPPTDADRILMAILHSSLIVEEKGERIGIPQMRKHAAWYLRGIRGAASARHLINLGKTQAELEGVLHELCTAVEASAT